MRASLSTFFRDVVKLCDREIECCSSFTRRESRALLSLWIAKQQSLWRVLFGWLSGNQPKLLPGSLKCQKFSRVMLDSFVAVEEIHTHKVFYKAQVLRKSPGFGISLAIGLNEHVAVVVMLGPLIQRLID